MRADVTGHLATAALPDRFARHVRTIMPNAPLPYDQFAWTGALVLVSEGPLEVVLRSGRYAVFPQDAVLAMDSLDVRELRAPGPAPTVLVAISRRTNP